MLYRIAIAVVTAPISATNYLCNRFWVFQPGLLALQGGRDMRGVSALRRALSPGGGVHRLDALSIGCWAAGCRVVVGFEIFSHRPWRSSSPSARGHPSFTLVEAHVYP